MKSRVARAQGATWMAIVVAAIAACTGEAGDGGVAEQQLGVANTIRHACPGTHTIDNALFRGSSAEFVFHEYEMGPSEVHEYFSHTQAWQQSYREAICTLGYTSPHLAPLEAAARANALRACQRAAAYPWPEVPIEGLGEPPQAITLERSPFGDLEYTRHTCAPCDGEDCDERVLLEPEDCVLHDVHTLVMGFFDDRSGTRVEDAFGVIEDPQLDRIVCWFQSHARYRANVTLRCFEHGRAHDAGIAGAADAGGAGDAGGATDAGPDGGGSGDAGTYVGVPDAGGGAGAADGGV